MNRNFRMILALVIYIVGIAAAVYVGGWVMIFQPVRRTLAAYTMGTLTFPQLFAAAAKCVCSLTVAGFIWCMGYIASNHVFDSRDE